MSELKKQTPEEQTRGVGVSDGAGKAASAAKTTSSPRRGIPSNKAALRCDQISPLARPHAGRPAAETTSRNKPRQIGR